MFFRVFTFFFRLSSFLFELFFEKTKKNFSNKSNQTKQTGLNHDSTLCFRVVCSNLFDFLSFVFVLFDLFFETTKKKIGNNSKRTKKQGLNHDSTFFLFVFDFFRCFFCWIRQIQARKISENALKMPCSPNPAWNPLPRSVLK